MRLRRWMVSGSWVRWVVLLVVSVLWVVGCTGGDGSAGGDGPGDDGVGVSGDDGGAVSGDAVEGGAGEGVELVGFEALWLRFSHPAEWDQVRDGSGASEHRVTAAVQAVGDVEVAGFVDALLPVVFEDDLAAAMNFWGVDEDDERVVGFEQESVSVPGAVEAFVQRYSGPGTIGDDELEMRWADVWGVGEHGRVFKVTVGVDASVVDAVGLVERVVGSVEVLDPQVEVLLPEIEGLDEEWTFYVSGRGTYGIAHPQDWYREELPVTGMVLVSEQPPPAEEGPRMSVSVDTGTEDEWRELRREMEENFASADPDVYTFRYVEVPGAAEAIRADSRFDEGTGIQLLAWGPDGAIASILFRYERGALDDATAELIMESFTLAPLASEE